MKSELIKTDILQWLKNREDKSVDCIITSPPYNLKGNILKSGSSAIGVIYNEYDDNKDNTEYETWIIEILNECYRILKDDGHMFFNHKPRYEKGEHIHPLNFVLKSKLYFYQEIIWQTKRRVDNGGYRFTPQTERIYWLKKNKNNLNKLQKSYITSDLWELGRSERGNPHPAPFPLTLPLRIIYSLYGDNNSKIILDPFAGSGTVGVASKILGHDFIGLDIDEKYIKQAEERIKNYFVENYRFKEELENYKVKKPYSSYKKNNKE